MKHIAREVLFFVVIGFIQVFVDTAVTIIITYFFSAILLANVAGRFSGALIGFSLNGTKNFKTVSDQKLTKRKAIRYLLAWSALTAISTIMLWCAVIFFGAKIALIFKPLIEAGLAMASFFISRAWVYR